MSTKKQTFIIILCVVLVIALFGVAYTFVKKHELNEKNDAIIEIVRSYIQTDENFEQQYGKCISVSQSDENIEPTAEKIYTVPCVVTVESGIKYFVWIDFDYSEETDKFTYISVTEIKE